MFIFCILVQAEKELQIQKQIMTNIFCSEPPFHICFSYRCLIRLFRVSIHEWCWNINGMYHAIVCQPLQHSSKPVDQKSDPPKSSSSHHGADFWNLKIMNSEKKKDQIYGSFPQKNGTQIINSDPNFGVNQTNLMQIYGKILREIFPLKSVHDLFGLVSWFHSSWPPGKIEEIWKPPDSTPVEHPDLIWFDMFFEVWRLP